MIAEEYHRLLDEGKLEDISARILKKTGSEEKAESLRTIWEISPDKKKTKYLEWAARYLIKGHDIDELVQEVLRFIAYEQQLQNIDKFTPEQIKQSVRQIIRKKQEKFYNAGGMVKVFEGDDWVVAYPSSKESSHKSAGDMKWCTATKDSEMFEEYCTNSGNTMFYFFNLRDDKTDEDYELNRKLAVRWNPKEEKVEEYQDAENDAKHDGESFYEIINPSNPYATMSMFEDDIFPEHGDTFNVFSENHENTLKYGDEDEVINLIDEENFFRTRTDENEDAFEHISMNENVDDEFLSRLLGNAGRYFYERFIFEFSSAIHGSSLEVILSTFVNSEIIDTLVGNFLIPDADDLEVDIFDNLESPDDYYDVLNKLNQAKMLSIDSEEFDSYYTRTFSELREIFDDGEVDGEKVHPEIMKAISKILGN